MNKLEMAHEYVMNYMASPDCKDTTVSNIVSVAWSYADSMQAEADKRNNKETCDKNIGLDSSVLKPSNSMELEWQPDWSQAPDGFNIFVVVSDGGYGFFTNTEPQLYEDYYYAGRDAVVFHNHGYKGPWQQSLRKRPQ